MSSPLSTEATLAHPLALGDPALDQEHATFQRLAEALRDAPDDAALVPLAELRAHAAAHFAAEDEDLRRFGGANTTCHLDEHAAVLHSFDEVREALQQQPRPGLGRSLAVELLRWLPEHVHAMDASLAVARTRQRFGGAPLVLQRKPVAQADTSAGRG